MTSRLMQLVGIYHKGTWRYHLAQRANISDSGSASWMGTALTKHNRIPRRTAELLIGRELPNTEPNASWNATVVVCL